MEPQPLHPRCTFRRPPRARSGGRTCLLVILLLLALVCVAGVAGAALFRDRLRDIPGIGGLPGVGGYMPTIAPPPVHTGSATVGSGQAAAISMPNGPMIEVPHGAVPPNPDGTPGTLTFSVRPAPDQPVSLPAEMALSGSLYSFEPEGVTFAVPVRITLPIPARTDPARVMGLVTRDAASGEWVTIAGTVDAAARTVSAEVTHFSPYGVYSYTGDDPGAWQRRNGGWFVLDNPGVQGDGNYPMCERLPCSVYVNVCIQNATLVDPGLSFHLPPDNLLAIGQGSKPLQAWLPAGTYRVVHFIFMSEINPGNPGYLPRKGWWVKPPQVITLQPNQTIRFERFAPENGIYMDSFDTSTCTGVPASSPVTMLPSVTPQTNPPGGTETLPQPPNDTGLCPAKMNGEWDARLTLRATNDPDSQDEIGDVEETIFAFQINGREALVQLVASNGERSDFARGTCSVQNGRYVLDLPQTDANVAMVFTLQFSGDDRMTGDLKASEDDLFLIADAELTRRVGSGQSPAKETPSTCTQEVELINNRYLGACGMSDTQTFDLARSVFVTRIRVWHYPDKTGTDTPYVTITGPNGYRFSGNTTKGDCYAGWCAAMVTLNQNLSPGTYTLSIPSVSICTDPSGKTTLILYGCSGADSPSTFSDSCPALTGAWDMTMNLVSSTHPDVPIGGTRQGVLNLRVENETVYAQWTEGGRQSQTATGTCTAQGDRRYQITLQDQMPELHPPEVQPPSTTIQVPLEELLFPITFDIQFERQDRVSGNLTVLAYNHQYLSSIVMSRR